MARHKYYGTVEQFIQGERATFYRGLKDVLLGLTSEEWAYLKAWRDADTGSSKQLADKTHGAGLAKEEGKGQLYTYADLRPDGSIWWIG